MFSTSAIKLFHINCLFLTIRNTSDWHLKVTCLPENLKDKSKSGTSQGTINATTVTLVRDCSAQLS